MSQDATPIPIDGDDTELEPFVDDAAPTVPEELEADDFETALEAVRERRDRALERLVDRWHRTDLEGSVDALRTLHRWRLCLGALRQARPDASTMTYRIDGLVLSDCYRQLFADPEVETLVYLTGVEVEPGTVTLNRMVPLDLSVQSVAEAKGDPDASAATLQRLELAGHQLLGHCHNHPGATGAAPTPSGVDRDFQDRLEGGGFTPLGLIMAEDGHVRLFTNDLDFEIEVHGSHIERRDDDRLYLDEDARSASKRLEDA
jgi:hypothetical protein